MKPSDTTIYDKLYEGNEPYVFISYAHNDSMKLKEIAGFLSSNNIRYWYDNGLHTGDDWPKIISEHIERAAIFLLLLSPESANSKNVKNELNFADDINIPIHILQLEDFNIPSDVRMTIGRFHRIKAEDGYAKKLVDSLPDNVFYATDISQQNDKKTDSPLSDKESDNTKKEKKTAFKRLLNSGFFSDRNLLIIVSTLGIILSFTILWKNGHIQRLFNKPDDTTYSENAAIPDLVEFSNGLATLESDETNNETDVRTLTYSFTSEKHTKIVTEYIGLIQQNFDYSLIHQDSESLWYTFKYDGRHNIDSFSLTFGSQTQSDINLSVFLYKENDSYYLNLHINSEIEVISTDKRTSLELTHIPSFEKYADVKITNSGKTETKKNYYVFSFITSEYSFESVQKIVNSYSDLIIKSYSFEQGGEKELDSDLKWFYWFRYTGANSITTYRGETLNYDGSLVSDYNLSIRIQEDGNNIQVTFFTAPEITFVENGEKY